jgi:hypothetical protein
MDEAEDMTVTERANASSTARRWEASLSAAEALAALSGRGRPPARCDRPAEIRAPVHARRWGEGWLPDS